jgi:hypothetical protein
MVRSSGLNCLENAGPYGDDDIDPALTDELRLLEEEEEEEEFVVSSTCW